MPLRVSMTSNHTWGQGSSMAQSTQPVPQAKPRSPLGWLSLAPSFCVCQFLIYNPFWGLLTTLLFPKMN